MPQRKLMLASCAGIATGLVAGLLHSFLHVPFLSLILAWGCGRLVGGAVRAAAGGYRDSTVTAIAAITTCAGFAVAYLGPLLTLHPQAVMWSLLYTAAAAFGAIQQSNS